MKLAIALAIIWLVVGFSIKIELCKKNDYWAYLWPIIIPWVLIVVVINAICSISKNGLVNLLGFDDVKKADWENNDEN